MTRSLSETVVTISTDMTRLGFCTDLCDKIGIRHTQVNSRFTSRADLALVVGADQPSRERITAAATHPKRTWPTSATHVNSEKPKKAGNPATRYAIT